jgi:hypothetical protein
MQLPRRLKRENPKPSHKSRLLKFDKIEHDALYHIDF